MTALPVTPPQAVPTTINSLTAYREVLEKATRTETACGEGSLVWHVWGSGPPVLLLHGGSGSWTHWVRNIGELVGRGYQVLAPDLPGFGDSSLPPDGRDGDVMPRWLELGLNSLIGNNRCTTIGFSFGAMVATLMAVQYPARIDRLIVIGAPALSKQPMPDVGLRAWTHLPPGEQRTAIFRHNLRALMLANDSSIDELAIELHGANLARDRLRRRRLAKTDIVVRSLPSVRCPLFGIWGAHDAVIIGREASIEPAMAQAPDFRGLTFLPQTGHWAQYEDSDGFHLALDEALDGA